jgi:hypothetical protein
MIFLSLRKTLIFFDSLEGKLIQFVVFLNIYLLKLGPGTGRIGLNLHVFYNPPRIERVLKLGSATRVVNDQSYGPQVTRIGAGSTGSGILFVICYFFIKNKNSGPKTRWTVGYLKSFYFIHWSVNMQALLKGVLKYLSI